MKNLFKSLANFQQEAPIIEKGTKGYGYTYADLPTIFNAINPLLKKHGLGFYQSINDTVDTYVFHVETGETISSKTKIPENVNLKGMNDFQVLGSAITYIRRYSLSSLLGLVTDKDVDAGGQQIVSEKDIRIITGKLATITSKADLSNFYNNLPNIQKTNKKIVELLKDKQTDLKQQ